MKKVGTRVLFFTTCVWVGSVACGSADEEDKQPGDADANDSAGDLGDGASSGSRNGSTSDAASGGSSSENLGETPPARMAGIVEAHNAARAAVNPAPATPLPHLSWSNAVAQVAQSYADKCRFEHSTGSGFGENIYASTDSSSPADVLGSWAAEARHYNYDQNSCSGVCGHYTQVVWATSRRLGCGVADCSEHSPFGGGTWQIWVCNYDPPGNFIGQRPY